MCTYIYIYTDTGELQSSESLFILRIHILAGSRWISNSKYWYYTTYAIYPPFWGNSSRRRALAHIRICIRVYVFMYIYIYIYIHGISETKYHFRVFMRFDFHNVIPDGTQLHTFMYVCMYIYIYIYIDILI